MPPARPPASTPVAAQLALPVTAGAPEGTPDAAAVLIPLLPHPAHSFQLFQHTRVISSTTTYLSFPPLCIITFCKEVPGTSESLRLIPPSNWGVISPQGHELVVRDVWSRPHGKVAQLRHCRKWGLKGSKMHHWLHVPVQGRISYAFVVPTRCLLSW